jgi:hypothetical protein
LIDGFGGRAVPIVSAISIAGVNTSTGTFRPLPVPTESPIPIPGLALFSGQQFVSGRPRTDSFSLLFGCGVSAAGTLSIAVQSTNGQGASDVSRTTVRVGA